MLRQPNKIETIDLELLEIEERPGAAWPGARAIPFSLLFRAVNDQLGFSPACRA